MAYKKKNWIKLRKNGLKIELSVIDDDWKKLETLKCNAKDFPKVLSDLGNRYNIPVKPDVSKSQVEEEIGFLKKDLGW